MNYAQSRIRQLSLWVSCVDTKCTISDVQCCCFSYYMLFNMKYNHSAGNTTQAKRLAVEMDISVRKAEQRLDAKLFLDEIPRWQQGGPHHALLYQKIFEHARAAGLRKYHHGICQGHWQPSPERSLQVGVSVMGLLAPKMTLEKILVLYQEVYQLKRDPGGVQCSSCAAEEAHAEILEVLKACLQCRQGSSWLE